MTKTELEKEVAKLTEALRPFAQKLIVARMAGAKAATEVDIRVPIGAVREACKVVGG